MGLADKILGRFSKSKTPGTGDEPDGDESASPEDAEGKDSGSKGLMLKRALASNDGAAIEEACRACCGD
jgi:hypothetical protein